MDAVRFDTVARLLAGAASRRSLVGLVCGGVTPLIAVAGGEARKKRKRKKTRKKTCTGGDRKCGKRCIPATSCCSSPDCGNGGACANGICQCPSGFRNCNGECVSDLQCCENCPGDKLCVNGECACPASAEFECPGDRCVSGPECCETEACPGGKACVDGACLCPGADAITCSEELCCDGATQICKAERAGNEVVLACQSGDCESQPATNFCADSATEQFICANDPARVCVCTSTADQIAGNACVDVASLHPEACEACTTSSACGSGRVCIPGGAACGCAANLCVSLCPEVAANSAERAAGGTPVDLPALNAELRKRGRSTP